MENGKDLIFIPRERSGMIQTQVVRKDVSCLTGGCQGRPGVFVWCKSQASTYSKNTLHATEHLKRVQMDFHFNQWDVNHSEVPYEVSTFPERDQA